MHICLTCIELFGDSIYGGFGRATRFVGRELAKRGVRVTLVIPRRSSEYPDHYELEGMMVHQFKPHEWWTAVKMFRECQADIYHSQDISMATFLAQVAAPRAIHVVTFRDPMDGSDWKIETDYAKMPRLGWQMYRLFIDNPLVRHAIARADRRFSAAQFLIPKTTRLYRLSVPPTFLPSPVDVPAQVQKAKRPTVCYMGRWEGRKRVELFFQLARQCPHIDFIAAGGARDPVRDKTLREQAGNIANLNMPGVLDQFANPKWNEVLGKSWIIVNTSLREGLPTTFIEAAAHRCAILSFTDPDAFASRFGIVAEEGQLKKGLEQLLQAGRWQDLGEHGWRFVQQTFSVENAMQAHLQAYCELLANKQQNRC